MSELKMKYHYSYFIYPYVIKEKNYKKYVSKLLKNSKCTPKYFEQRKNLSVYNYFLPNIREYMFKSFEYSKVDKKIDEQFRENLFKSSPCVMFDYNIGDDVQAKTVDEDGIFFKIQKMEIICFKTGICFLAIKTNIEDTENFGDLLNFNFKFRDINSEVSGNKHNNIKIQTSTFEDVKELSEVIKEITGSNSKAKKLDIDVNKFLVYSYVCLDQECWNENKQIENFEKEFFKYVNVLNSDFNSTFGNDRLRTIDIGKYIKLGINKVGINLLTTSVDTINYTTLPFEYEHEYLYTYIFTLYEKFYLTKIMKKFKVSKNQNKVRKEFVDFTNNVWVHEPTNNDNGTSLYNNARWALELEKTYARTKEQYDVMYKNFKMKNNEWFNRIILVLLAASIVTNIINFINLYKVK